MSWEFMQIYAERSAAGIEALAVTVIVGGIVFVLAVYVWELFSGRDAMAGYVSLRSRVGRVVLLSLELLVAADIIETVAVELTLSKLGTLAILVLIRTFLSLALEVEIEGRWPWQGGGEDEKV